MKEIMKQYIAFVNQTKPFRNVDANKPITYGGLALFFEKCLKKEMEFFPADNIS